MRSVRLIAILVFGSLLSACGGVTESHVGEPGVTPWVNVAPTVLVRSPEALSVGDPLMVIGDNFIARQHGTLELVLRGSFFDEQGVTHPVEKRVTPKRISKTQLSWNLWPDVVFHPQGDKLGYFVGELLVINIANDGDQKTSGSLPTRLEIKPSLIPRMVQPRDGGCAPLVGATLQNTGFNFVVEAIGLRPATTDAPLTFHWTFLAEHWRMSFGYNMFNADSVFDDVKKGAIGMQEEISAGTTATIGDAGSRNYVMKLYDDLMGDSELKELRTREVPKEGNNYQTTINVAAVDASGKTARLTIPLSVHRQADMYYDGGMRVAERFEPQMLAECIPGEEIGRNLTFREDSSESYSRSMTFQYNANVGGMLGLPSNPFALGLNFTGGFGVDVNATVSTQTSQSIDYSGRVLPGNYATFWRQTSKMYRVAKLVGRTQCGDEIDLGEVTLTDWIFTPSFGQHESCPVPLSKSKLPPAERLL